VSLQDAAPFPLAVAHGLEAAFQKTK